MARVLTAEDDETDRLILGTILEGQGHELHVAGSGEQVLRLYQSTPIDVVVTDIVMKRTDGVELILALKAIDPSAAIIALSGKGEMGLHFAALAGAAEVMTKPIDQAEQLRAVDEAASRRSGATGL